MAIYMYFGEKNQCWREHSDAVIWIVVSYLRLCDNWMLKLMIMASLQLCVLISKHNYFGMGGRRGIWLNQELFTHPESPSTKFHFIIYTNMSMFVWIQPWCPRNHSTTQQHRSCLFHSWPRRYYLNVRYDQNQQICVNEPFEAGFSHIMSPISHTSTTISNPGTTPRCSTTTLRPETPGMNSDLIQFTQH